MWWPFGRLYPERRPEEAHAQSYDYVVIGAGTAGCALASRLSEDPNITVLVLERGPANDTWMSRIPLASSNILRADGGATSWNCEPMRDCGDRRSLVFRAEVMGGGSRINSMVYTRGTAADYDDWAALGHPNWSYEKVLPYFVRGEKALDQPKSSYRGDSGPWIVRTFTYFSWLFRAYQVFTDCAEAMGFGRISDTNAPDAAADGVATLDTTVNEDNQRVSTFDAFLPREVALSREKTLTICTKTVVSSIKFSGPEGGERRAEEVVFKSADPKAQTLFTAKVKKEVIVCSGSLGSPQVLMLSGIGPRAHLEEHGIDVVKDLPGVGSNLTDHIGVPVAWEVPLKESLAMVASSPVIHGAVEFFKYLFFRSGVLAIPIQTLSLFVRTASLSADGTELRRDVPPENPQSGPPRSRIPDIELMPLATSAMDNIDEHFRRFSKIGVFSILATLLQPASRGTVRLASTNPHDKPAVEFGILSAASDLPTARTAVRLSLKIGEAMKAAGFPIIRNLTFNPTAQEKDGAAQGTEELDKFIRERARTTYHYACSCRMAAEDDLGVVDDELRVHGLANLRVCDTSVFPKITSSHLQAPAVMVAERCAEFIKKGH